MLFLYSSFNIAALCISANNNTVMLNLTVKKNKNLHIPKKLSRLHFIILSISTLFTQKFIQLSEQSHIRVLSFRLFVPSQVKLVISDVQLYKLFQN